MEHKLRINTEVIRQPKAPRILLPILRELLAQPNQHPVQPSQHIGRVVCFRLKHGYARHQHRCSLLVEGGGDRGRAGVGEIARDGGNAEALLARGMLVVRDELDEAARAGLEGLAGWSDNFEVDGCRGARRKSANLPCRGLTDTDFRLADTSGLFARRNGMSNETRNFQFFRGLKENIYKRSRQYKALLRTWTSKVALKAMFKTPLSSLLNSLRKPCLKILVANESERSITPLV